MNRGDTFDYNGHRATVLGVFAEFVKVSYTDRDGDIFIVHVPHERAPKGWYGVDQWGAAL